MTRIEWAKNKKKSKSRVSGSNQPKPGIGFLAEKAPLYLISILFFLFSKEFFGYDEEFIILCCLFIVFFVLIEGLKNQIDVSLTQGYESVLDFYLERFLFTKWGLIKIKKGIKLLAYTHVESFFITYYLRETYFKFFAYNHCLRSLYLSLVIQEILIDYAIIEMYLLSELCNSKNFTVNSKTVTK